MKNRPTPEQSRLIDELMEVEALSGSRAGIIGREWCEACGDLGNFSGFAGAIASHRDHNRFVCWKCSDGNRPRPGSAYSAPLDFLIAERGFRYCSGCGREVIIRPYRIEDLRRLPFTCPNCEGLDRGAAARRRYLEHVATQEGGLEATAARIHWAKREIEAMLSGREPSEG